MKKKICISVFICVLALGLLFLGVKATLHYGYIEGRVLITDSGAYFIVLNDHSPIRMMDHSLGGGLFGDLQTGDRIGIVHGSIQESYPGNTAVYYLRRLEKGTVDDVFPDVVQKLAELGF